MNRCTTIGITVAAGVSLSLLSAFASVPHDQPAKTIQGVSPPSDAPIPSALDELKMQSRALQPLVTSDTAKAFLNAVDDLPLPEKRIVYRRKDRKAALSQAQFDKLPEADKDNYTRREYDARFYYTTGYGSPLVYARPLDLLAHAAGPDWDAKHIAGKRILDFGYGLIGQLRLIASMGADVTGVDVEPLFQTLYSDPMDTGVIKGADGAPDGKLRVLLGQWPAGETIVNQVKEGGEYDLFISKNTLKRGYIHPVRVADPGALIHLGVDDPTFIKAVYDALKPGGYFLIYNISPAQSPADQQYIPHADGQTPFERKALEDAGFSVVEFDKEDREPLVGWWMVLGYNAQKSEDQVRKDLYCWWTLCRKPETRKAP